MPAIEELEPCENGYHLCRPQDLIHWLNAQIFEAEYKGECIEQGDKIVVEQVRLLRRVETWNEKTARLFACWCVRQVWDLLGDERSKNAVRVAEKYARGEATDEELAEARAEANVAAWDAASVAAWDAARAEANVAAWDAAWDAAWAEARAEAKAEARDAARAEARAAQTIRLLEMLEG